MRPKVGENCVKDTKEEPHTFHIKSPLLKLNHCIGLQPSPVHTLDSLHMYDCLIPCIRQDFLIHTEIVHVNGARLPLLLRIHANNRKDGFSLWNCKNGEHLLLIERSYNGRFEKHAAVW